MAEGGEAGLPRQEGGEGSNTGQSDLKGCLDGVIKRVVAPYLRCIPNREHSGQDENRYDSDGTKFAI